MRAILSESRKSCRLDRLTPPKKLNIVLKCWNVVKKRSVNVLDGRLVGSSYFYFTLKFRFELNSWELKMKMSQKQKKNVKNSGFCYRKSIKIEFRKNEKSCPLFRDRLPRRIEREWRGQFVKGNSGQLMVSTFDVPREKWWRTLINCASA